MISFRNCCLGAILLQLLGCRGETANASPAGLYDLQTLRSLHLQVDTKDWYQSLKSARADGTFQPANLIVDGRHYPKVGVRFRGKSSYTTHPSRKKSLAISMDAFKPGQNLLGYQELCLSNAFHDPTLCREILSYQILRRYLPASKANYVKLYINGDYRGVFVNVQRVDAKLLEESLGDRRGTRYRGDASVPSGDGHAALQWLGPEVKPYQAAYQLKSSSDPEASWAQLIELCETLHRDTLAESHAALPRILDVDEALWYLAVNSVLANFDSYLIRGNDFYLHRSHCHGVFSILPWDMNESFGGYLANREPRTVARLSIWHNHKNPKRPLFSRLVAHPEWRARYLHHVRTVAKDCLDWRELAKQVKACQKLIGAAVEAETDSLYGTEQFRQNVESDVVLHTGDLVPGLRRLVEERRAYLQEQAEWHWLQPKLSNLRWHADDATTAVTVEVGDAVPVAAVTFYHRVGGRWREIPMIDDGQHRDGAAGDGRFGALLPTDCRIPGQRVECYVGALAGDALRPTAAYLPRLAAAQPHVHTVQLTPGHPGIRINELCSSNRAGITDEQNQHEDWAELHNTTPRSLPIGGMFLTDDPDDLDKWQLPSSATIAPGGYLLIWCDRDPSDGPLHTNFKLGRAGASILLVDRDAKTPLGILISPRLNADQSFGWSSDGTQLEKMLRPSPGRPNEARD